MNESRKKLDRLRLQLEELYLKVRAGEAYHDEILIISTEIDRILNSESEWVDVYKGIDGQVR